MLLGSRPHGVGGDGGGARAIDRSRGGRSTAAASPSATTGNLRLGATIGQDRRGPHERRRFTLGGGFWIGGQPGALDVEDGGAPRVFRFTRRIPIPCARHASRSTCQGRRAWRSRVYPCPGRAVRRWDFGVRRRDGRARVERGGRRRTARCRTASTSCGSKRIAGASCTSAGAAMTRAARTPVRRRVRALFREYGSRARTG